MAMSNRLSTRSSQRRTRTYLNAILTVNAVLIAALVWTNVSDGPVTANASPLFAQVDEPTGGVPNAGAQRERMIAEVRALREDIRGLESALSSGKLKVNIGNMTEVKKLIDDSVARATAPAPKVDATPAAVTPSSTTPARP
jgi:hypothetical protein